MLTGKGLEGRLYIVLHKEVDWRWLITLLLLNMVVVGSRYCKHTPASADVMVDGYFTWLLVVMNHWEIKSCETFSYSACV